MDDVYEAGSTGKNTTVSGYSDLDVVVVLKWQNFRDFDGIHNVLKEIEKACKAIYFSGMAMWVPDFVKAHLAQ